VKHATDRLLYIRPQLNSRIALHHKQKKKRSFWQISNCTILCLLSCSTVIWFQSKAINDGYVEEKKAYLTAAFVLPDFVHLLEFIFIFYSSLK
jgi:uncharacterized membrane protein YcjF (UPF0283 family)